MKEVNMELLNKPHRRLNPLTGEWVLVSPHRTQRPWNGKEEIEKSADRKKYDPNCYLCPGNMRANGEKNPQYSDVFIFQNDFSALLPNQEQIEMKRDDFLQTRQVNGTCRVICFTPEHDLSLALAPEETILNVITAWKEQLNELRKIYPYIQIFENKGEIMGCSNPHPHGQIWAGDFIPEIIHKESINQKEYYQKNSSPLLMDYLVKELNIGHRIILENDDWAVLVPYWALWPYETMIIPKKHRARFNELNKNEMISLSKIMKKILVKYDNLFHTSFPYSMGWHYSPYNENDSAHWTLHGHFYPPLLRSASIKKFMVGYEMMAEPQRDITAEQAAEKLISLSEIHYLR